LHHVKTPIFLLNKLGLAALARGDVITFEPGETAMTPTLPANPPIPLFENAIWCAPCSAMYSSISSSLLRDPPQHLTFDIDAVADSSSHANDESLS
jgi:hypothetical protein